MNPLHLNSPIIRFLTKMADMIILNVLTVLTSLPIVTIGAANAALHSAVDKCFTEEGTTVKNFFRAFKSNFRQATICWLLLLVLIASCVTVLFFMQTNAFGAVTKVLCFGCLLICGLEFVWVFPLQANFNNTTLAMLRNALICAFSQPVRSLLMLTLNLVPFIMLMYIDYGLFLKMTPLWLFGWFSGSNCLCRFLLLVPMRQLKENARNAQQELSEAEND